MGILPAWILIDVGIIAIVPVRRGKSWYSDKADMSRHLHARVIRKCILLQSVFGAGKDLLLCVDARKCDEFSLLQGRDLWLHISDNLRGHFLQHVAIGRGGHLQVRRLLTHDPLVDLGHADPGCDI